MASQNQPQDSQSKDFIPECSQLRFRSDENDEDLPLESCQNEYVKLCPFNILGSCRYDEKHCFYIHGEICEYCDIPCILPGNEQHKTKHIKECILWHEKQIKLAFAEAQSQDKVCGICLERVWEKPLASRQRFGLLPNCKHIFCINCIRSWRQTKTLSKEVVRSCPECRIHSDFVFPSTYWIESKEKKERLIAKYKTTLSNKICRYYKSGRYKCPFGKNCFYLHDLPGDKKNDEKTGHHLHPDISNPTQGYWTRWL